MVSGPMPPARYSRAREDEQAVVAQESNPGWEFMRIFGGWMAVPAGTTVLFSVDVDGVTEKIRMRGECP